MRIVFGQVRACDSYSEFGQNATSETPEAIDTEGPDCIASVIRLWEGALRSGGRVVLYLQDGTKLEGKLHSTLCVEMIRKLKGRLVDLKRAYKQLARSPDDAPYAIVAIYRGGRWQFFISLALGFGAKNAVPGFNLPARAMRFLLNKALWIAATHYFDDYSHIEPEAFASAQSGGLVRCHLSNARTAESYAGTCSFFV